MFNLEVVEIWFGIGFFLCVFVFQSVEEMFDGFLGLDCMMCVFLIEGFDNFCYCIVVF